MTDTILAQTSRALRALTPSRTVGRLSAIDGAMIWADGLDRHCALGDTFDLPRAGSTAEAICLRDGRVGLLAEGAGRGLRLGDKVLHRGPVRIAPCDGWLGQVIAPDGRTLEGAPSLPGPHWRDLDTAPLNPGLRKPWGARLRSGYNLFDTFLPLVKGQRVGLFAGSGVGKSTLIGHFCKRAEADVIVLALIGERGREIRDFVADTLGPEAMARTVVVAAPSDRSATDRKRCLLTAMTVAEHFRDSGRHVLFLADSITRYAEAHREIAIAAGELPAMRGYPPSLIHDLMKMCERAGPGREGSGDITALFSVLVAGSDMDEPVADILRGTLDGHILLDRSIAEQGRFPAVDVLRSVSRSLPEAASQAENTILAQARRLIATADANMDMVRAGLYRRGTDPEIDAALTARPDLETFLTEKNSGAVSDAFDRLALILRRSGLGRERP